MHPAALERARNFTAYEFIDALAHASARTILRGGHVHVMPHVVLDAKVPVAHQTVRDLCGNPIRAVVLMPEFVAEQDRAAAVEARAERKEKIRPPGQVMGAEKPRDQEESGEQKDNTGVQKRPIVIVARHGAHHFLRRIVTILSHQRINDGYADECVGQRVEQRPGIAVAREIQRNGNRNMKSARQRQKPQVSLAVVIANRLTVCRLTCKFHPITSILNLPKDAA